MMKLLEKALQAVRGLSEDEQDDIARTILALVGGGGEEVRAVWAKYGL
jgi:hypothetical protein